MKAKLHFFGKDCLIDRKLLNRDDIDLKLEKYDIKCDRLLFVNQVHGMEVVIIDDESKIYDKENLPKADAIVTNLPNVGIGVFTADCAPILLLDEKNKIIAAIHAGWRGAKGGVIKATVAAMKKLGAENIEALIGPMIQQPSYEVSNEFLVDFLGEDLANEVFFMSGGKPDKALFDLPSYVEKKLHDEGIAEVKNSRIDTYESAEDFFSFRRAKRDGLEDCGRNVSVIVLNNN